MCASLTQHYDNSATLGRATYGTMASLNTNMAMLVSAAISANLFNVADQYASSPGYSQSVVLSAMNEYGFSIPPNLAALVNQPYMGSLTANQYNSQTVNGAFNTCEAYLANQEAAIREGASPDSKCTNPNGCKAGEPNYVFCPTNAAIISSAGAATASVGGTLISQSAVIAAALEIGTATVVTGGLALVVVDLGS